MDTQLLFVNAGPTNAARRNPFTYQLGSRYFAAPGVYTVRWEGQNFRPPDITFRVMPSGNGCRRDLDRPNLGSSSMRLGEHRSK
jgi:hypothetical protein